MPSGLRPFAFAEDASGVEYTNPLPWSIKASAVGGRSRARARRSRRRRGAREKRRLRGWRSSAHACGAASILSAYRRPRDRVSADARSCARSKPIADPRALRRRARGARRRRRRGGRSRRCAASACSTSRAGATVDRRARCARSAPRWTRPRSAACGSPRSTALETMPETSAIASTARARRDDATAARSATATQAPRDAARPTRCGRTPSTAACRDDPASLREALQTHGAAAPLGDAAEADRCASGRAKRPCSRRRRGDWRAVRGATAPGAGAARQPRRGLRPAGDARGSGRCRCRSRSSPRSHGDRRRVLPRRRSPARTGRDARRAAGGSSWQRQFRRHRRARNHVARRAKRITRLDSRARSKRHERRRAGCSRRRRLSTTFANQASTDDGRPHLHAGARRRCSAPNGMLRSVACVSALICASHSALPHQPAITNPGRPSITALELVVAADALSCAPRGTCSARSQQRRLDLVEQRRRRVGRGRPSASTAFSRVSRRATITCDFSMSFGPISMRSGTPRSSHSANFQPGV